MMAKSIHFQYHGSELDHGLGTLPLAEGVLDLNDRMRETEGKRWVLYPEKGIENTFRCSLLVPVQVVFWEGGAIVTNGAGRLVLHAATTSPCVHVSPLT